MYSTQPCVLSATPQRARPLGTSGLITTPCRPSRTTVSCAKKNLAMAKPRIKANNAPKTRLFCKHVVNHKLFGQRHFRRRDVAFVNKLRLKIAGDFLRIVQCRQIFSPIQNCVKVKIVCRRLCLLLSLRLINRFGFRRHGCGHACGI